MSYSDRISKLRVKHLTNNKTYPPFIDIVAHKNNYEAIDPINFNDIKDDCVKLNLHDGTRSSPQIYYNEKLNKYYIRHIKHTEFIHFVFDVSECYDWVEMLKGNEIRAEFRINDFVNIKHTPNLETNRYFPGSPQYERQYPSE